MYLMKDLEDLWDHVAYMVLCCPDSFPYRDFLGDDQMNMEKGYAQLHEGIAIAYPTEEYSGEAYDKLRSDLAKMLETSKAGYERGDLKTGAFTLQDFRDRIFLRKGRVRLLTVD